MALRELVWVLAAAIGLTLVAAPARAQPAVSRYELYYAEVVRVIDGDTLEVRVFLWPGLIAEYAVRVRGIDAPEIRGPGCEEERVLGEEAKAWVERFYKPGMFVRLENVDRDPFAGRVVADVARYRSDRWLALANELIDRQLAVEWEPTQDDPPWCLLAQTRENDLQAPAE